MVSLLDAENCQFGHNRARNGGAVHVVDSNRGSIHRCHFAENMAGGLLGDNSNLMPQNGTRGDATIPLKNNAGHGGAIFFEDAQHFNITAPEFLSNLAHGRGGAFHCAKSGNLALSNSRFLNNSALHTGGAISVHRGNLSLSIDQFTKNHAVNGSLLSVSGGIVNGSGIQTYQNMADEHGGLVYCTNPSSIRLATSKFVDDGSQLGDSFMANCSCQVAIVESKIVCSNDDVRGCGLVAAPDAMCDSGVTLKTANVIYYNKFWSIFKLIVPALVSVPLLILIARFCMLLWTGTAKKLGVWKEDVEPEPLLIDGYPDIWGPLLDDHADNDNHPRSNLHVHSTDMLDEHVPWDPSTNRRPSTFHRPAAMRASVRPVDSVQSMTLRSHRLRMEDDLLCSPNTVGADSKKVDYCISNFDDSATAVAPDIKCYGITGQQQHPLCTPSLKEHRITVDDDTPSSVEDLRRHICHTIHEQQDFRFEYEQMIETRFESSIFD